MADSAGMSIQPAEVADVTRQLDELANRVQRVLQDEATNLTVIASGRDEVSQRVAGTLNEVHTAFGASADQGLGILDAAAIERVCDEAFPRATNADELHEALLLLGLMTNDELHRVSPDSQTWLDQLEPGDCRA